MLEKINQISGHLSNYPIVFAYLFGSFAKGESTSLSDIDMAVYFETTLSKSERFDMRLRLVSELSSITRREVDITVMNDAPVQLAYEIIKYGREIICKNRQAMRDMEINILSKYLDRRYYDKRRAAIILEKIKTKGLVYDLAGKDS